MWLVVCLRRQSLHKSELDFFHLFKLAAVGRVSMEALRRNLSVPCFKSYIALFHTISSFSAAARARNLPWTAKSLTCPSHFCRLSRLALTVSLTLVSNWFFKAPVNCGICSITVFVCKHFLKVASASTHVLFLCVSSDSLSSVALIAVFTVWSPFNLVLSWLTAWHSVYISEMLFTPRPWSMWIMALVALGGIPDH